MVGRNTMTVDGTPVSAADIERMEAEERLHAEWQRRTVRVVAASASNAEDCRLLLSILGLDEQTVAEARAELPAKRAAIPTAAKSGRARPPRKAATARKPVKARQTGKGAKSATTPKANKPRTSAAA